MTEVRGTYSADDDHAAAAAQLQQLAARMEQSPQFMAWVLEQYRRGEGKNRAGVQQQLGVDDLGLARLALCRTPTGDAARFRREVQQIAHYTGADEHALAQIVRHVTALAMMPPRPEVTTDPAAASAAEAQAARTAAARARSAPMAAARDRLAETEARPYGAPAPLSTPHMPPAPAASAPPAPAAPPEQPAAPPPPAADAD